MKQKLTYLFLLLTTTTFSQSDFWDHLKVGAVIAPEMNQVQNTTPVSGTSYGYESVMNYTYGAQFLYKFDDKVELGVGLNGANKSFVRTDVCTTCDVEISTSNHFVIRYLELPLSVQYYLQNDRLDIFAIGGIQTGLLTNNSAFRTDMYGNEYNYIQSTTDFTKLQLGVQVGAGINYNLTYRGSVGLNVVYKNYLGNFSSTPSTKMSGLSIQPGIFYQF